MKKRKKVDHINHDEMMEGYKEMAGLNLQISQSCFLVEDEGTKLGYDKMDTKETKNKAI